VHDVCNPYPPDTKTVLFAYLQEFIPERFVEFFWEGVCVRGDDGDVSGFGGRVGERGVLLDG